jgi:hypothetical protein
VFRCAESSVPRGGGEPVVRTFCRQATPVRSVCIEQNCKSVYSTCTKPSGSQPLVEGSACGRERKDGYRFKFNVKKTTPFIGRPVLLCEVCTLTGLGVINLFRQSWPRRPKRFLPFAAYTNDSYLVDPASSDMLVSKIKPCMSKYKRTYTVKLRMAH